MANAPMTGGYDPGFQKLISKALHHRVLSRTEERKLILRAQAGDAQAMRTLGEHNLKLILFFANRYRALGAVMGFSQSELFNEAYEGFHKAVYRFKTSMKTRLSTYAQWWMRHAVQRAIEDRGRMIRIPVHTQAVMRRVERAARRFFAEHGRVPTREELAKSACVSLDKLAVVADAPTEPLSYDAYPPQQEEGLHLLDMYRNPDTEDRSPLEQAEVRQDISRLAAARGALTKVENAILDCRYKREMTLNETASAIAALTGGVLSRERVRQLQQDAERKLRTALASGKAA